MIRVPVINGASNRFFHNAHLPQPPNPEFTPAMDLGDYVADSEGEENLMDTGVVENTKKWDEDISTFGNGNGEERTPHRPSSISNFTTLPDDGGMTSAIVSAYTTPSVKPRPRPKPKIRRKQPEAGAEQDLSHISAFSDLQEPGPSISHQATNGTAQLDVDMEIMSSIADRAKTRERKQPKHFSDQQWDEDHGASLFSPPAKKKKAQMATELDYVPGGESSKSKGKKGKGKLPLSGEVIDISDDDVDELNIMTSASKPKDMVPTFPVTSIPQPTDLIPTEPVVKPRPKPRPLPKKPRANPQAQAANPVPDNRASTPARPPPDTDLPSSSAQGHQNPQNPPSLPPSDPPLSTAHSMGIPAIETLPQPSSSNSGSIPQREPDGLFSGDEDPFAPEPVVNVEPDKLLPPPTFFAGSSSQVKESQNLPPVGQEGDVSLPEQPPLKEGKPKTKRKKKNPEGDDDEDAEWGAGLPKEKKSAKKRKALEVEVLITSKPPEKGKREKGKKKKSEGASSSTGKGDKPKEVFKSREMIEDSDEDPLLGAYGPEEGGAKSPPRTTTSNKGKSRDHSPDAATLLEQELDMLEDDAEPVTKKGNKKKRKAMVVEDEDDSDDGVSRKGEGSSKRQKRAKTRGDGPGDEQPTHTTKPGRKKGKAKALVISEDEEEAPIPKPVSPTGDGDEQPDLSKENIEPSPEPPEIPKPKPAEQATPKPQLGGQRPPRYSIASRAKPSSMNDLIKRVNSLPNSPFPVATSSRLPTLSRIATSYSPYIKSSRSMLSKIAPLHPNRRTPPPPLPPPPPRKKTKKELEREEKWEEELIDSLGGLEAWIALSDAERRDMRKAKFDMEMGGWDD